MTSTPDATLLESFRALWRAWIWVKDNSESISAWPDPLESWSATHPTARVHPGVQCQPGPDVDDIEEIVEKGGG